ncbi:MAG: valine--tRNA ligase, partial [Clostridia bacterium]|nr:valine--tRNA ligase [Clostridia bacterium]
GHCYRCHTSIEPIVSKQWFVKMEQLAKPAIAAVKDKSIKFTPTRFTKIYFNWMENIKDWCISRQLWWGHRIPVYYCNDCGAVMVKKDEPVKCDKCGSRNIRQDEDVLDTWFSSALWPFSTLGFPEMTEDLKYFYPTNVLVTGYDIIFFWVARMIFSGLEHMNMIPFKDVLIHGIVRDDQGRKMSKSLGNGVDPLSVIAEYGADTLRFSLVNGVAAGSDIRFSKEKCESSRNFINKIWNASRFVLMNLEGADIKPITEVKLDVKDKWILSKLNKAIKNVTIAMEKYDLGVALSVCHDFMWYDFCDWYIELTKPSLYGQDEVKKNNTLSVLHYVLDKTLKLLHPFIPFVTEEIYSYLPNRDECIMRSQYPTYNPKYNYKKDAEKMDAVMDIIKAVRQIKVQAGASATKKVELIIVTDNKKLINDCADFIYKLAGVSEIVFVNSKSEIQGKVFTQVLNSFELYVPLGDLVDVEKEIERLKGELEKVEGEIERANGKLANVGFIAKAPKQLVEQEKQKLEKYIQLREKILANLQEYEN